MKVIVLLPVVLAIIGVLGIWLWGKIHRYIWNQGYKKGEHSMRVSASRLGYGYWEPNDDGETAFMWKTREEISKEYNNDV